MTSPISQKILFMGLGASGKSSIRSVIFDAIPPEELADYSATINYTRSTKNVMGLDFSVIDCGGQASFLFNFIGEQAEFIFSDVKVLIWVIDIADFEQVSTSKFYFDHAIRRLNEYSPGASVFCFFHKVDLIQPARLKELAENMEQYFIPEIPFEVFYHKTSIYTQSIYKTFGEVLRALISQSMKAKSLVGAVRNFIRQTNEFKGITVFTEEGLPVIEEGAFPNMKGYPSLILHRMSEEFSAQRVHKLVLETNTYVFVFQKIMKELFVYGVASKVAPLQFAVVKMEQLAKTIKELI